VALELSGAASLRITLKQVAYSGPPLQNILLSTNGSGTEIGPGSFMLSAEIH
jgi:hypothetical protein